MTNHEVTERFLTEWIRAMVATRASHHSAQRARAPVQEVADAALSRFVTLHPDLFTKDMGIEVRSSCLCGQCPKPTLVILYNKQLTRLLLDTV
jgi:hypothetical protein